MMNSEMIQQNYVRKKDIVGKGDCDKWSIQHEDKACSGYPSGPASLITPPVRPKNRNRSQQSEIYVDIDPIKTSGK
ncbi:unnamed protein product [Nippostrongylus brasiliensis]|uniref:Uncharacterized protein n=1 Tax=Nippostrongylus brasiliensis TaxID=27835 RepID=A0A0N4XC68_NIPBR|nr:unnamed protein product [Nippostrongylus brasiliensis]